MRYDQTEEDTLAYERKFHQSYQAGMPKSQSNMDKITDFIQRSLDRTKILSDVISSSENEREFFLSLNELNRILYDLTPYEKIFDFPERPSAILRMVYENRGKYINRLHERIKEKQEKNFDHMSGYEFEYFCAEVLQKAGYTEVEVTQSTGDHGIDVLAKKDDISYAIQCKCYSSNIGNSAVQQAHTGKSLYRKDIAAVITNRYFTPQAVEEAKALGVKLWDRDKLTEMIGNNG